MMIHRYVEIVSLQLIGIKNIPCIHAVSAPSLAFQANCPACVTKLDIEMALESFTEVWLGNETSRTYICRRNLSLLSPSYK